jgi:sugar O-acyltransferase (sialic acid O-acetyltransferase NeuD family)
VLEHPLRAHQITSGATHKRFALIAPSGRMLAMSSLAAENKLVIYGASGHGYAMALGVMSTAWPRLLGTVVGFIDDYSGGQGRMLEGIPIYSIEEWREKCPDAACIVAVSQPPARALIVEKILEVGGTFARPYDGLSAIYPSVAFGRGIYVDATVRICPLTTIGDHVQIMPMTSIGHDVNIADTCTICPSCVISGHVSIEPNVFLGAGSIVVNGKSDAPLVIGRNSEIWAGSVVTKSISAGSRVAGNPARPLREFVRDRVVSR